MPATAMIIAAVRRIRRRHLSPPTIPASPRRARFDRAVRVPPVPSLSRLSEAVRPSVLDRAGVDRLSLRARPLSSAGLCQIAARARVSAGGGRQCQCQCVSASASVSASARARAWHARLTDARAPHRGAGEWAGASIGWPWCGDKWARCIAAAAAAATSAAGWGRAGDLRGAAGLPTASGAPASQGGSDTSSLRSERPFLPLHTIGRLFRIRRTGARRSAWVAQRQRQTRRQGWAWAWARYVLRRSRRRSRAPGEG
ncbi:hypothetical protein HETIRDRAFT_472558 [Heterobasidion irregulare TC 32-1]|uniref:Uncharacterized protein n=1 Tax=Heterobasidion irregulare (strain TC 32-1) TaxID=747525 RepID=W4KE69_HETIT|nr:uncharacterized protein HETIRDRAFT_472558 [Heterobasidion irregulare TC 32-1]ETW84108.1 hypothetical protein HETIRDRAFT_472558 [Heterobasidion irregulare TC 32-1]